MRKGGRKMSKQVVPINEKVLLTINEAAEYFGIGHTSLRRFLDGREDDFCVCVGNRRLVKREKLEDFIKNRVTVI